MAPDSSTLAHSQAPSPNPEQDLALKVAEALELEDTTLAMTDHLRSLPSWDSLGELCLVAMLDEEYGVQIEKPVLDELVTLQDLFDEVMRRRKKAGLPSSHRASQ